MKTHNFHAGRAVDLVRGRTGTTNAGVGTLGGSPIAFPTTTGDLLVYDSTTDSWVIVNDSTFGSPLTIKDEGTPLATAATSIDFVGAGVTATGAGAAKTVTIPSGGGGTGTPGWFNVKDAAYGAIGDGVVDDTSAINLAIAALVAAGRGVLYFPAGTYKVTASLSVISVPCLVMGDGKAGFTGTTDGVSRITCTSTTAYVFNVTASYAAFRDLAFDNSAGGTPSDGAAIACTPSTGLERIDVESCSVDRFYYGLVMMGTGWTVRNCHIYGTIKYGILVRNTAATDFGDWVIADTTFWAAVNADAAIRIESSGGGKITNCKINMAGSTRFVTGIDLAVTTGTITSVLLVSSCSIENISGDAIRLAVTGSGAYGQIIVSGCQFGLYTNNAGRIVNASGAAITYLLLDDLIAKTDGTARAAIALTNVAGAFIGEIMLAGGFNAVYTNSGVTSFTDDTGSIAGVAITGTPSSGDLPVASSGTAAAWGSLSSAGIAPNIVDYLVGTASAGLTSEIVVGTTPGGELGNTWASPTVDTTHSGSSHADAIVTAEAYADAAIAAATPAGLHAHVTGETHLSDGSTTTYTLDEQFERGSVEAFNTTTLAYLVVTEAQPDQATVSAAGSSGDKITFSYAATVA